jgi:hypothetical protein
MKQKDLRALIERAAIRDNVFLSQLGGARDNPSAQPAINAAVGRLGAFRAILDAMAGNPVQLRIMAEDLSHD